MQITFDTNNLTDDEVRGIFALLDTVRPEALAVEEPASDGYTLTVATPRTEPVEEPVSTFDGEEFPQSPVPPTTDSTGLLWDERIHSGTKALNADGTWRTKRGVDKALVAEVESELRQTQVGGLKAEDASITVNTETGETVLSAEQVVVAPPAPPAPPAPEAPTAPLAPTPNVDTNSTAVQVAESSASTPAAATGSATSPFVALMKRVTTAQGSGKLTAQRVKELLEGLDKKSIMDLRTDTDALDAFAVLLDGEGV